MIRPVFPDLATTPYMHWLKYVCSHFIANLINRKFSAALIIVLPSKVVLYIEFNTTLYNGYSQKQKVAFKT